MANNSDALAGAFVDMCVDQWARRGLPRGMLAFPMFNRAIALLQEAGGRKRPPSDADLMRPNTSETLLAVAAQMYACGMPQSDVTDAWFRSTVAMLIADCGKEAAAETLRDAADKLETAGPAADCAGSA